MVAGRGQAEASALTGDLLTLISVSNMEALTVKALIRNDQFTRPLAVPLGHFLCDCYSPIGLLADAPPERRIAPFTDDGYVSSTLQAAIRKSSFAMISRCRAWSASA
jgi:hypothetical protein